MKNKMTNYFYQIIQSAKHAVIPFKDNDFVIFSFEEITKTEYSIKSDDKITCLLSEYEYSKLFGEISSDSKEKEKFPQTCEIACVISYKTLETKFDFGVRKDSKINELTGVFYINTTLCLKREKNDEVTISFKYDITKLPWFSRAFIEPSCDQHLEVVTSEEKINKYLEDTTENRAKIDSWKAYIAYCDDYFTKVANLNISYESNCYLFKDNSVDATMNIEELYRDLMSIPKSHSLYDRFTKNEVSPSSALIPNDNVESMCKHSGQMNGKYPLADSQREAVNHFKATQEGEILAVSGPPGTGKTTLLQSLVADLIVDRALNDSNPPIIVATSSNNQAVTNIIDSFRSVEKVSVSNLEERWVDGVNSFATYMPSDGRKGDAKENGYQFTSTSNNEFILEAIGYIEKSKRKMMECANQYFDKSFASVSDVKETLQKQLEAIDSVKCSLLRICDKINQITEGEDLLSYIDELTNRKLNTKKDTDEYKSRLSQWREHYKEINIMLRLLSFIPSIKRKINNGFIRFSTSQESVFINYRTSFSDIDNYYSRKVLESNNEANHLSELEEQANVYLNEYLDCIEKLRGYEGCREKLNDDTFDTVFNINKINTFIDSAVRYIEFWFAIHINECRFLLGEFKLTESQRGKKFENVLKKFYSQIALLSPCFVMTLYMLPKNFKTYGSKENYMYDFIDLLIVDEAGQCSPEIAAASFSLAKRAVVVGDENQIPPVVTIDRTVDYSIAMSTKVINEKNDFIELIDRGLSCSQGNVMRVAKNACKYQSNKYDRGLFLCEHRRCYDEIITYSNELLYNGMLVPMRNKSEQTLNHSRLLDKEIYPYMGHYNISTDKSSTRGTSRFNEVEAKEIAAWLKKHYTDLIASYIGIGKSSQENVLAIITPFKAQVSILKKHLKSELKQDADNISVGTVHTFQGAERNIIIFSTVYGENDTCSFIDNNKNLMNVAVSRAKDAFWVFGSIDCIKNKSENSASGLLYKYISRDELK